MSKKTEFELCYWFQMIKQRKGSQDALSDLLLLTSAVVGQSVAIVTLLAMVTGWPVGVVQALEALPSPGVT